MTQPVQITEAEHLALLDQAVFGEQFLITTSGPTGLWLDPGNPTNAWAVNELKKLRA